MPLLIPERGGSLDELASFLNISSDQFILVKGWLLECRRGGRRLVRTRTSHIWRRQPKLYAYQQFSNPGHRRANACGQRHFAIHRRIGKICEATAIGSLLYMTVGTPSIQQPRRRRRWPLGWVFVAPFLFFYGVFLIYPAIQVCYLSLTNSDIAGEGTFVGLQNYITLINDQDFWASVGHTVYFVVLTVVPNTAMGFFLALLVVRLKRLSLPILSAFFCHLCSR
jgi:hypothetical protein